jgi:DNA-directed RNA polymerase specialized sigma24 family protein
MDLRNLFLDEHDRLFQYLARFIGDDDLAADVI